MLRLFVHEMLFSKGGALIGAPFFIMHKVHGRGFYDDQIR